MTTRDNQADNKADKTSAMDPADAARAELHSPLDGGITLPAVFGDKLFGKWADQVKADDRYRLADPDDPRDQGAVTNSSGANPPPALIVQYGEGPNDYISTVFDAGQVIVQDGNDPTGRAWKFAESGWRRFVARVRGDKLPDDEQDDRPGQYEEAAAQQKRTNESIQADRDANTANAAKGGDAGKTDGRTGRQ